MFLAHFSKDGLDVVNEWPLTKIHFWFNEAHALYKKMNPEMKMD